MTKQSIPVGVAKLKRVTLILGVGLALGGCAWGEPQPVKTVYVTQTPAPTSNSSTTMLPQSSNNEAAYLNCVGQADQILRQANQLRDQALSMSINAGFGAESDQALAGAARSLEQQATQMVFQYQNMLRACDALR